MKINGKVIKYINPFLAFWYVGDNVLGRDIVLNISHFSSQLWTSYQLTYQLPVGV